MDEEKKKQDKQIARKIEAILFWNGEAMKQRELAKILQVEREAIKDAISQLTTDLADRGIVLLERDDEYMLVASAEVSELLEQLTKEELNKELGKAALETLSIILYQGPIKRSELDFIRGVNSQAILRNLMVRGLVDKEMDKNNARSFVYKPSFELMSYLNIKKIEDLPDYQKVREDILNFRKGGNEEKHDSGQVMTQGTKDEELWDGNMDNLNLEDNWGDDGLGGESNIDETNKDA